jgi:hypothetical protein
VSENIVAAFARTNEPVPLCTVEPLHDTICHILRSLPPTIPGVRHVGDC